MFDVMEIEKNRREADLQAKAAMLASMLERERDASKRTAFIEKASPELRAALIALMQR